MTTAAKAKRDSDAKAVFRRFTEAAADLIDCPETPEEVSTAVLEAVSDIGTRHPEDVDSAYVRRALGRALGLKAGENEGAAQPPVIRPSATGRRPSDEDRESFRRLAEAFAVLFELEDYLPGRTAQQLGDIYTEITLNGGVQLCDPGVIRLTFPILAECGGLEFEDEPDEEGGKDESEE